MTAGERGESGDRGDKGERGVAGERGMKGDHGQDGETGATGRRGPQGDPAPYLDRRKTLALFAFVVLAFTLLAARSEINANDIRRGVYENCLTRAEVEKVTSDCERFR